VIQSLASGTRFLASHAEVAQLVRSAIS
jgi:hypothetical protein